MAPTIIAQIHRRDLQGLNTPLKAEITDVKHLSSYSWIEALTPTIVVPGILPLWSPLRGPQRVKKDSGLVYIAQNAARHPESPLEPLFRAIYLEHPSFDIEEIDIVTDRNNIRKLLTFVDPGSTQYGLEPFTINIEVIKNTAIFCRDETATHEIIGPNQFRGFGHEFEKAYTKNETSLSTGHHRVISYRFGGLSMVIRHETDAYVQAETSASSRITKPSHDELSSMLGGLSLSSNKHTINHATTPKGSVLTVKEEGKAVPLDSTLEIKTRVAHRQLSIGDVAPQLWVSQTPKLVRAYHTKGVFQEPQVEDVVAESEEMGARQSAAPAKSGCSAR